MASAVCLLFFLSQVAVATTTYEQHRGFSTNYTSPVYAIARLAMLLQNNKQHY